MNLWIVGKYIHPSQWEFQGVYSNEQKAVEACRSDNYFVGPCTLNEEIPDKKGTWPGAYYPHLEPGKKPITT